MAVSEFVTGTASVSSTEIGFINNSTSIATSTTSGSYQLWIDVNAIAAGDQYEIYLREKVITGGTQRQLSLAVLTNPQTNPFVTGSFLLMNGWDFSMKKLAGTDRTFPYSIRRAG